MTFMLMIKSAVFIRLLFALNVTICLLDVCSLYICVFDCLYRLWCYCF